MDYDGNWTYATIRGSGHMVPEYKPAAGLALISAFLEGRPLPEYQPTAGNPRRAPNRPQSSETSDVVSQR